jgi:type IV pilus assembly protein PilC
MSLFNYKAIDTDGHERQGTIDAVSVDVAITALQRRGLVVAGVEPQAQSVGLSLKKNINLFGPGRVKNKDIVMLSRQMTTLFDAQVSALRSFQLLATEAASPVLQAVLVEISTDIQGGSTISASLSKHPNVFSPFYVAMVRAGEEAGKLNETFAYLADYLDRNYEIANRAKNALIYPIFVVVTFVSVMVIMMTVVVPKLAAILQETGGDVPIYTKVVIGISTFMTQYFVLFAGLTCMLVIAVVRYARTDAGSASIARLRLQTPYVGDIFVKLYMSRIADNLSTMLRSDIQMVRSLEITSTVVGDPVYEKILAAATLDVQKGITTSEALRKYPEIPSIAITMLKIGEETGNVSGILEKLATFYRREVNQSVDTLVGLIEPLMIVMLAVGVGFLLAAVLMPIYNISAGL